MWTIVQLNSRQSGKQTAEEAKEKKKEIMVEKNLEHVGGGGGGGGANELNGWTFRQLPPMPNKTQKKNMKIPA